MEANNVINYLTSLINKCNLHLEEIINDSSFNSIISKIINIEEISEEELNLYREKTNKISNNLSEEELITLDFLSNYLINKNIPLADNQRELLIKIENSLSMTTDIETAKKLLDKNKELLSELENGKHIDVDTIEKIRFFLFDELKSLNIEEIKLSPLELNKIIFELIEYNIKNSNNIEKIVEVKGNDKLLDESLLEEVLNEYGYNYNFLDDEAKLYLRRYSNIDNIDSLLSFMAVEGIALKLIDSRLDDFTKSKEAIKTINMIFTRILVNSDVETLIDMKQRFENSTHSYAKYIMENPEVIIGPTKKTKSSIKVASGDSTIDIVPPKNGNFRDNDDFFKGLGFDFDYLMDKIQTIFLTPSDNIKLNYDILTKVYDLPFTPPKPKALTALVPNSETALSNIDRFIESAPRGYDYIKNNPAKVANISDIEFYQIRLLGDNIFYEVGDRGLIKYTSSNSKIDDSMRTILKYNLSEIQQVFDSNSEPRTVLDSETILKLNAICIGVNISDNLENDNLLNNPYINYLESNCRIDENNNAYPYLYNLNGTLISRKKVLRIYNQLLQSNALETVGDFIPEEDFIKYAISYNSILNEEDVNNINNAVSEMTNAKTKKLNGGI